MQKGFTVIELLIVIAVIAILATIGLVSYNGFQKKAIDTSVQSDLESIGGELEAYRARPNTANPEQRFPTNATELTTLEIAVGRNSFDTTIPYNLIYCIATTGTNAYQSFKLVAQSKSGTIYLLTEDGFVTHSLTSANLNASFCTSQSMTLGSNGMTTGPTWASWARAS